jgi:hypothetical protein
VKRRGRLASQTNRRLERGGLSAASISGLLGEVELDRNRIRQIPIPDPIGLVDRCETCHLGVREPIDSPAARSAGRFDAKESSRPAVTPGLDAPKCSFTGWS